MSPRRGQVAAVLAVAALGAACESDPVETDGDSRHAEAREQVLAAADTVTDELVDAIDGDASGGGSYRGCGEDATGDVDQVEYAVTVRVDPGRRAPTPLLTAASPALEGAGFTVEPAVDVPSGRSVRAAKGDLGAAVTEYDGGQVVDPATNEPLEGSWLILRISGPCLDVDDDTLLQQKPDELP